MKETRVFLRLPGTEGSCWPFERLINKKLQRLIAPGPWNNDRPPVRAYDLRKMGASRGIPLIEHMDLIQLRNQWLRQSGLEPLPLPQFEYPPIIEIPVSGGRCPYTGLKHTILHELAQPFSQYENGRINVARYHVQGSAVKMVSIETESLFRYIRSLPPPRYKILPPNFPDGSDN